MDKLMCLEGFRAELETTIGNSAAPDPHMFVCLNFIYQFNLNS